jgi:hypothetical protein
VVGVAPVAFDFPFGKFGAKLIQRSVPS